MTRWSLLALVAVFASPLGGVRAAAASVAPVAMPAAATYKTYTVVATREGLVGNTTANGHVIVANDHFVALPSARALNANDHTSKFIVRVCAVSTGRCETAPVYDIGPWNAHDDYWNPASVRQKFKDLPQGVPEAQAAFTSGYNGGKDEFGRTTNGAGIDLADGTFHNIGLTDNGKVTVAYLWTAPKTLSVGVSGSGSVVGTGGITCPGTCSASLVAETSATLTATPRAGSAFRGWGGACSGTASTCAVSMSQNQTVTAKFEATSNLLADASFERSTLAPWGTIKPTGGTTNIAVSSNAANVHEGARYAVSNTNVAGGSVFQDVALAPVPGQSYAFSMWVRAGGGAVSGTLAVWGEGGTVESQSTTFTVGTAWTLVTAPLDVVNAGHTAVRVQLYENTPSANYYLDGAQLVRTELADASFERIATAPWTTVDPSGGTTSLSVTTDAATSHDGPRYATTSTTATGGSVYQDVAIAPVPGQSYTFSMWLRSAGGTVSGTLNVFGLKGGTLESVGTPFTVGTVWTLVSVPLDVASTGHTGIRVQLYETTAGTGYFLDGAQLQITKLTDASFERSTIAPWGTIKPMGGSTNVAVYTNAANAHDGARYAVSNTTAAGGSVFQDVTIAPVIGQSYTFSIWIRAGSGTVSGTLSLFGWKGGTLEVQSTPFTVGTAWTLVSAPLDVANGGHTAMRAQLYENTPSTNYYLDSATLTAGNAR